MSLPNRSLGSRRSRSRKRAISVESATTELTRLPGLEVAESKPEVKPEHWIESGPSKRLMLFAGRSHPELAHKIAEELAAGRPAPDGAADHDRRREARVGEAHHGSRSALSVLAAGQEVTSARADHRQARRRDDPVS